MNTILAFSVVGLSAVTCFLGDIAPEVPPAGYIQYGALGLCGFMVYFLCNHIKEVHKNYSEERKEVAKQLSRIAVLLEDRPCLKDNKNSG